MSKDPQAALDQHLKAATITNGIVHRSTLAALIEDARGLSGRGVDGKPLPDQSHGRWGGAVAYLILLDQIGKCFKIKGEAPLPAAATTPITKALARFSSVTDERIWLALYALRNALVHDYSLFNKNPGKPLLQHAFVLDADPSNGLIRLPEEPWDGNYGTLDQPPPLRQATVVNLFMLAELVEACVCRVEELSSIGQLELEPSMEPDEFAIRYKLVHRT